MKLPNKTLHLLSALCLVLLLPFCTPSKSKDTQTKENLEAKKSDNKEIANKESEKTSEKDEKSEGGDKKAKKRRNTANVAPVREHNDIARFIAGLPAEEGSTLASLAENESWKQYATSTDAQWKSMEAKLPKMQEWAKQELKQINQKGGTLFYPFAGADFLHATTFFPQFDEIVMIGLEPIGTLPNFESINKRGAVPAYFNGMRQSLISILQYSYFQTLHMANDFNKRVALDIDGTLPVLLFFMERTGHRILKYEKVAINPEGDLVTTPNANGAATYYGTKIVYQPEGSKDTQKTLYYFSVNLGDEPYGMLGGLPTRTDLKKYIESLDITATYLKSASYLMYNQSFKTIRSLIVDNSQYVLQDDSGMPMASFDTNKFDLLYYGVYAGPIPLFSNRWQNDMKIAYQNPKQVRALPFGIGYQHKEGTSNLMLATKK